MLLTFTGAIDKSAIAIQHNLIMLVGKGQGGITTNIQTGIMTPKGPVILDVLETVEEVVEAVNNAIKAAATNEVSPPSSKPSSVLAQ